MPTPVSGGFRGFAKVAAITLLFFLPPLTCGAQSGIAAPVAVGPFLNSALPTDRPLDPSSSQWTTSPTFTNLDLDLTLVIEPNPINDLLYVASRDGLIQSFDGTDPNTSTSSVFLDLRDRVGVVWDGGFLGMTFHPDYGTPGTNQEKYFYVYYSARCDIVGPHDTKVGGYEIEGEVLVDDGAGGLTPAHPCKPQSEIPDNYGDSGGFFDTYLRLSRFEVDVANNVAIRDSEIIMAEFMLWNGSHRGGGMAFKKKHPESAKYYLWVTIGDQFRYETAQDIANNFEGGVIRIDVEITESLSGDGTWSCPAGSHLPARRMDTVSAYNDLPGGVYQEISGNYYCIPDDNPWQEPGDVFEEFATLGHRNPHRMSKDPLTGRLWSGEIGSSKREEINVIELGRNYGWPYREGFGDGVRTLPGGFVYRGILTDPVIDFDRADAKAIIGGYVYRGSRFPELYGKYLAGDYSTNKIWAFTLDESTMIATKVQLTTFATGALGTWGQDKYGEVYLGDVHTQNTSLFTLERVGDPVDDAPAWLSLVGAFDDLPSFDVADYFVPYDLVQPFWSDNADKTRFAAIPNDGTHDTLAEQIVFSASGDWDFPVGTVLMKHFELQLDENDPTDRTRLETRFLVRGNSGPWYGLTYRWLPDLTDAYLLTTDETADYTIQLAGGGSRVQTWLFPSRDQCLSCHSSQVGGAAGPRTHQLNNEIYYAGSDTTAHQLKTWSHLGMFDVTLTDQDIAGYLQGAALDDATESLERRARSWLDSNCSYCHRPELGRAVFDARLTTPLTAQQLINGHVETDYGIPDAHVITPGEPGSSIAFVRMESTDPVVSMPPLAKTLAHLPAVDVLREWIERVEDGGGANGVNYEYYETAQLGVLPDFDSLIPDETGTVADFDISIRKRDSDYAFRYTSLLYVSEGGDYTFYTNSDDGSQLFIDTALIVDNDGLHAPAETSGNVTLTAGYHDIVVTFFERGGGEVLDVSWAGPSFGKQPVSVGSLFLTIPVPVNNVAPVLTSPGGQVLHEGEQFSLALTAIDADLDSLWFSANNLPEGLTLDSALGAITGAPVLGSEGDHAVIIGVSDGPEADSVQLNWVVNVPPQFNLPAAQLSGQGDGVSLQIVAWDTQPLTYTAAGLPPGLGIGLNDGEIAGAVTGGPGLYAVMVTIDDGYDVASFFFDWFVTIPGPDGDGDGMPDVYETANNLDPLIDDSMDDLEGDGFRNIDEYRAGTDPDGFDLAGDVDGDDSVTLTDLLLLQRHIGGLILLDGAGRLRGDAHPTDGGDGRLDVSDVLVLQQLIAP